MNFLRHRTRFCVPSRLYASVHTFYASDLALLRQPPLFLRHFALLRPPFAALLFKQRAQNHMKISCNQYISVLLYKQIII